MRIGPMHDRIQIDECINEVDALRAPVRTWVELWTAAAQIDTQSAREYFANSREEAANNVVIRMRYHPRGMRVNAQCRATDTRRGIVYAITGVLFDDKRTMLTITARSGVSDG